MKKALLKSFGKRLGFLVIGSLDICVSMGSFLLANALMFDQMKAAGCGGPILAVGACLLGPAAGIMFFFLALVCLLVGSISLYTAVDKSCSAE